MEREEMEEEGEEMRKIVKIIMMVPYVSLKYPWGDRMLQLFFWGEGV